VNFIEILIKEEEILSELVGNSSYQGSAVVLFLQKKCRKFKVKEKLCCCRLKQQEIK